MNSSFDADRQSDAYEVISFRPSWSLLALVLFGLSLASGYLVQLQPWRPQRVWLFPLIPPLVMLALSSMGLAAGFLGLRYSAQKSAAKVSLLLNGIIVLLILLVIFGMLFIVRSR